ncbi:MAG: molybdenum cofactor guanylyltransferase [Candidatus Latescibacterota bacterium]
MILQPRMLMLGSTGRNSGKTELACRIIHAFKKQPIIGIKVTTVRERDGRCPRGGEGCGVCSSLEGDYLITEERSGASGKDTMRMISAGAERVFWLRVMADRLAEGFTSLQEIIGEDAVIVCESNSLRLAVEPGLFLMVREQGRQSVKESGKSVIAYADREVVLSRSGFDIDPGEIALTNDCWFPRWQASAAVLAGGGSSRMGRDKSLLPVNGQPLITHIVEQLRPLFPELRISTNSPEKYGFLGVETIADEEPGQGPLMGILSSLEASARDLALIIACDIPEINTGVIRTMLREAKGCDAVVPLSKNGRPEPLFALYRKSMIQPIRELMKQGARRISDVFGSCRVRFLALGDDRWLLNLNHPGDYARFVERKIQNDTV